MLLNEGASRINRLAPGFSWFVEVSTNPFVTRVISPLSKKSLGKIGVASMLTKIAVRILLIKLIFLVFLSLPSIASAAAGPLEVIKSGMQQVMDTIRGCQPGDTTLIRARRQELMKILDRHFDFREMSRRALGPPWRNQPPAKQDTFAGLFKDLMFNTYVDKVATYMCSDGSVEYEGQQVEGDFALVRTKMTITAKNMSGKVEYRLKQENGEWRVYDVVAEGISIVNNYREQFNSILASKSFDHLLQIMRDKVSSS